MKDDRIMPEQADREQHPNPCPNCGYQNTVGALVCRSCGIMLQGGAVGATYKLDDADSVEAGNLPAPQQAEEQTTRKTRFEVGDSFSINIREVDDPLVYQPQSDSPLVLGRRNTSTQFVPDIDLYPFAGYYLGVSRRHAVIYQKDEQLQIEDLGSSNGTFVDNVRLSPRTPQPLYDGVEVRLGRLHFTITF